MKFEELEAKVNKEFKRNDTKLDRLLYNKPSSIALLLFFFLSKIK